MYQLTFSEQSMSELEKLNREDQLSFVSKISDASNRAFTENHNTIPKFQREGKTFYRIKVDTYRAYIEKTGEETILCQYILPKHTLSDFLFRSKFPVSEEQMVEQHSSFWKYLESLKK